MLIRQRGYARAAGDRTAHFPAVRNLKQRDFLQVKARIERVSMKHLYCVER